MFFQLLYIHLFRPFLKYSQATSPLPSNVSPRKICSQAAAMISKLLRLYKRTYGLCQICNIAVYIAHSACTIHLLNLPDKDARRDIAHGVRQLEEIAESWPCARRTLVTLAIQVRRWSIDLPTEPATVLARAEGKYNNHIRQSPDLDTTSPIIQEVKRVTNNDGPELLAIPEKARVPSIMTQKRLPSGDVDSVDNFQALPKPVQEPVRASNSPTQKQSQGQKRGQAQVQVHGQKRSQAQDESPETQQYPEGWTREKLQQSAQTQYSPAALFPGTLDDLFEDNKDWWLRDQSLMYDHWSKPGAKARMNNGGPPNAMNSMNEMVNNVNPMSSNPISEGNPMMNMNGQVGNVSNVGQVNSLGTASNGMGYLGFEDDIYNYGSNGNIY